MIWKIWACSLFVLAAAPAAAQTCDLPGGQKLEAPRYWLAYRTKPQRLRIGEQFSVDLMVCPKGGQPAPESVQIDGFMPEHNHGMNYKAVVKPLANGSYEATGLMFHMPGKWDFIFDVRGGGKADRVTHTVTLQ